MVRKPFIARRIHRIPHNFIFFATFGGKGGIDTMQHVCVHRLTSMHHVCVCMLLVKQGAYTIQKKVF
jgi:hypothetical protein